MAISPEIENALRAWDDGLIGKLELATEVICHVQVDDDLKGLVAKLPLEIVEYVYDLTLLHPHEGDFITVGLGSGPRPNNRAVLLLRSAIEQSRE